MTSASSTTNINKERKSSLLGFTLKQYWTSILLFSIILFFVIPVPVMMSVSDHLMHSNNLADYRDTLAINWVEGIRYAIVPIMSILAVVIPCARFKYLKNKVSIDFYHSLPIKRQSLFFTQLGVGVLALFIPYILNVLITLIYVATNGLFSTALILNLSLLTLELVVYAIFFYSLSTLVGMACGLTAVQLVLTAVAIFILPVAHLVAVGFADIFVEDMWYDFYLNESFMEKTSPAMRFILNEIPLNLTESIIMIVLSVVMLGLALFLYLHRKSERAGQSVVFVPFGEVVKYILMFVGTLLGGLLFNSIMNDAFWTIFGMVCGMVLVFMLANTILHKTAKAMFRGVKGLIIFGAAAVITLILLSTNAFGINSNVPSPGMTSKVVVDFDNTMDLTFRDKANIEAVYRIYKEGERMYTPDKYGSTAIYGSEDLQLEVAFYNFLGIPTAKRTYIYNKSDFINEFQTILNSEEFREQYSASITEALALKNVRANINLNRYYVNKYGRVWDNDYYYGYSDLTGRDGTMFERVAEQLRNVDFNYFQQPTIGSVSFYSNGISYRDYGYYYLRASVEEALNGYISSDVMPYPYSEYIKRLAGAISYIEIYESNPDFDRVEPVKITDKAQIEEILYAASDLGGHYRNNVPFTFVDTEYYGVFQLDVTRPLSNDCRDMSEVALREYIDTYYNGDNTVLRIYENAYKLTFRLGQTPAFIPGLFGK